VPVSYGGRPKHLALVSRLLHKVFDWIVRHQKIGIRIARFYLALASPGLGDFRHLASCAQLLACFYM